MTVPSKSLAVRTLLLVFACLVPMAVPAVEDTSRVRTAVDAEILPLMSQHDIPGMAVGLILDSQPHVYTYGVASKETNVPVTEATLFEIGSVSKTFTATLAAYAQVTGKLSLDDHPGKYLPQLKGKPIDRATLLHLATYTAGGLPLQFPEEVTGEAATMNYFRNWKPLAHPGTRREYSNASPGLLGLVTASALNGDFATLMQSSVFRAFGMTDSFIHVPDRKMADYAWGYRKDRPVRANKGPREQGSARRGSLRRQDDGVGLDPLRAGEHRPRFARAVDASCRRSNANRILPRGASGTGPRVGTLSVPCLARVAARR